jgi:hypothetical protein
MISLLTILDLVLAVGGLFLLRQLYSPKRIAPLPPGPRQWLILGNLLDMPTEKEWLTFEKWGKKWGMCFSIRHESVQLHS